MSGNELPYSELDVNLNSTENSPIFRYATLTPITVSTFDYDLMVNSFQSDSFTSSSDVEKRESEDTLTAIISTIINANHSGERLKELDFEALIHIEIISLNEYLHPEITFLAKEVLAGLKKHSDFNIPRARRSGIYIERDQINTLLHTAGDLSKSEVVREEAVEVLRDVVCDVDLAREQYRYDFEDVLAINDIGCDCERHIPINGHLPVGIR